MSCKEGPSNFWSTADCPSLQLLHCRKHSPIHRLAVKPNRKWIMFSFKVKPTHFKLHNFYFDDLTTTRKPQQPIYIFPLWSVAARSPLTGFWWLLDFCKIYCLPWFWISWPFWAFWVYGVSLWTFPVVILGFCIFWVLSFPHCFPVVLSGCLVSHSCVSFHVSPVSHVYSMFPPARHVSLSHDPLSLPSCVPSIPLSTAFPPVSSSCVSLRLCVSRFILITLWSMFIVFSFAFPVASCLLVSAVFAQVFPLSSFPFRVFKSSVFLCWVLVHLFSSLHVMSGFWLTHDSVHVHVFSSHFFPCTCSDSCSSFSWTWMYTVG